MRLSLVMRRVAFVAVTSMALGGCGSLPSTALSVLEGADAFKIYALEPYASEAPKPGAEVFHGHEVLAQADIKDAQVRSNITSIVNRGVRKGGDQAKCFNPRHGIHATQAGRTVDLVICYECSAMELIENGTTSTVVTGDVQAELDAVFHASGVAQPK